MIRCEYCGHEHGTRELSPLGRGPVVVADCQPEPIERP